MHPLSMLRAHLEFASKTDDPISAYICTLPYIVECARSALREAKRSDEVNVAYTYGVWCIYWNSVDNHLQKVDEFLCAMNRRYAQYERIVSNPVSRECICRTTDVVASCRIGLSEMFRGLESRNRAQETFTS
jgi:hypothetical protein